MLDGILHEDIQAEGEDGSLVSALGQVDLESDLSVHTILLQFHIFLVMLDCIVNQCMMLVQLLEYKPIDAGEQQQIFLGLVGILMNEFREGGQGVEDKMRSQRLFQQFLLVRRDLLQLIVYDIIVEHGVVEDSQNATGEADPVAVTIHVAHPIHGKEMDVACCHQKGH